MAWLPQHPVPKTQEEKVLRMRERARREVEVKISQKKTAIFGSGTTVFSGFGAARETGSKVGSITGAASGFGAAFGGGGGSVPRIGFGTATKATSTSSFGVGFGAPLAAVPKPNLPDPKDAVEPEGNAVFHSSANGDAAANAGEEDEERLFQE